MLIVALQTEDDPVGNFAAKACADYSVTVWKEESYGALVSSFPTYEIAILFMQKT
jgi:hypothetical protein